MDESQLVTLKGDVNPHANAKNDRGAVSPSLALPDLTLVLSRSPEQQTAFDAFVASQYDPGSPNYHHWLTPQEIGEQFGTAEADITTIGNWLTSQGFAVKQISPDRMTIRFSGTAAEAESAFHTEIHNLSVNGVPHFANMTAPQIPAALAPVVVGVKALHNFLPHPLHKLGSKVEFNPQAGGWQRMASTAPASSTATGARLSTGGLAARGVPALNFSGPHPEYGINGNCGTGCSYLEEDVTPYDFATIYNVLPLWNGTTSAGVINGTGETIAIAGTSLICAGSSSFPSGDSGSACGSANDVATYRSAFGLPAYTSGDAPKQIDTGGGPAAIICTSTSPYATCGIGDLLENSLDVEMSGGVAPGAQIDLVVTGQNSAGSIDTVYDSAAYVVENETAKILSLSYGECELGQGTANNVAFYDLWQSAAAEGISVFVATGDSGSPSCDQDEDGIYGNPYTAQYGLSVSGMAATPYNVAVGGTDFSWCQPYYNSSGNFAGCADSSTTQGSPAYWNTSTNDNNTTTGESATNYVPEIPWNDTCLNPINARFLET
ncbi:MAG: protease pro-enzyme activation domain-containing protein, partial [Acidobacteriaceae bacterium]